MNARVLTANDAVALAGRLATYLSPRASRALSGAAQKPLIVVDGPPSEETRTFAAAVVRRGGEAFVDGQRFIVVADRDVLASLPGDVPLGCRPLAEEVLRAAAADAAPPPGLRLRSTTLTFEAGAGVMGILNVTPDSFYDRGAYRRLDAARSRAAELLAAGATLIDIGGQSYAAGAPPVEESEECARVVPVVEALRRDGIGIPLSVDTFRSGVAEAALAAGADLINDCSGLRDPRLAAVVARYDAALVVMHLKGELGVREPEYRYADVSGEVLEFLRLRLEEARAAGVAAESLVVDPGLEFGKEPATDLEILAAFGDLRSLGVPILLAASRKSFIGHIFGRPASDLLVPSLAVAAVGILAGARLVRAHDVAETVQVAKMLAAVEAAGCGATAVPLGRSYEPHAYRLPRPRLEPR